MSVMIALLPGNATAAAASSTASLPSGFQYDSIYTIAGKLEVSGVIADGGNGGPQCIAATIDPSSLKFTDVVERNCSDPSLDGEEAQPYTWTVRSTAGNSNLGVAVRNPRTGEDSYGPALFQFQESSGTHPEWTYGGDGTLWIYEPETVERIPTVIRVSIATGKVLQRATVPQDLGRGLITADKNGLYIAPAGNSFTPWNGIVYEVPIGGEKAINVDPSPNFNGYASFFVATGETVWIDICDRQGPSGCTLDRFAGKSFTKVSSTKSPSAFGDQYFEGDSAVGSGSEGYFSWNVRGSGGTGSSTRGQVVRLDPSSGSITKIGMLTQPTYAQFTAGTATVEGDALYVLTGIDTDEQSTIVRLSL